MTLVKQTILIVVVALTMIFACTFFIAIYHTKGYFEEQLQHNASDTSTSLGLSISSKIQQSDNNALILSIISAAFDRGYFNKIAVVSNSGKEVVSRYLDESEVKVPQWFLQ
jgi:hypothetical protein